MNRVITAEEKYPIQPEDINASKHFFGAFGNIETEVSAGWIIRFLQDRGQGWKPFTQAEIYEFYSRKFTGHFCFHRLINSQAVFERPTVGWIVLQDDLYYVTHHFICECHKSSPTIMETVEA
jgi:hypothetical protein